MKHVARDPSGDDFLFMIYQPKNSVLETSAQPLLTASSLMAPLLAGRRSALGLLRRGVAYLPNCDGMRA
jgi:hypothetical protein